jgi:hypothetical protein
MSQCNYDGGLWIVILVLFFMLFIGPCDMASNRDVDSLDRSVYTIEKRSIG